MISARAQDLFSELDKLTNAGEPWSEQNVRGAAGKLALDFYAGSIGWVGDNGANFSAQFAYAGEPGLSGAWPEWAYKIARDALLHKRKIWVIASGPPVDMNIVWAVVTNEDA